MRKRWIHIGESIVLFLLLAGFLPVAAGENRKIVVWRLEKKAGVSKEDIDSLSGFITGRVAEYSGMKVFSEADARMILQGEETRQKCGSEDTACLVEISGALGAPEAVSGDLGKLGSFWILNLRRINVKRAEVIARSNRSIQGSIDNLIMDLPGAVAELFGKKAAAPLRKTAPLPVSGNSRSGGGDVEWVYSRPAKLKFTKTEITLGQFKQCVNAGACKEKNRDTKSDTKYCNWGYSDRDDHPMNCVNWYGAKDFCEWVGGRLPTEDEWYAEASNNGKRDYPWGDEKATCDYAVMDNGTDGCGKDRTWPVCSKPRGNSVSGLCDMSGNVWEWTSSLYESGLSNRVLRGGGWGSGARYVRASYRYGDTPDNTSYYGGFRCSRD